MIDVHCHVIPETLPDAPASGHGGRWPCMVCDGAHRTMTIAGKPYRSFDDRNWSAARRIDYMDGQGIALQVLSPLPELLSYWFDAAACGEMCAHVNGAIAGMVAAAPERFGGFAMVPLQDPARAALALEQIKGDGFLGVEIGSNIDGVSPADARFSEFFAAVEELGLAIFVHGIRPAGVERLIGHEAMGAIVGVPMDTALCLSSMLAMNFPERYPRLRMAFSHGGGAFGVVLGRFAHVRSVMPGMREVMADPKQGARAFYYDILTFDADYVNLLARHLGADRLLLGTDFPAGGMGLMEPRAFIESLSFSAAERAAIGAENPRRYLGFAA